MIYFIKKKVIDTNIKTLFLVLLAGGYLITGIFVFNDYGVSTDEAIQRQHSFIVYKYLNKKLLHREREELNDYPDLEEYQYKYYGVALQLPLVFIEDLYDFQLTTRAWIRIRHLYTFLICFLGNICFYFFLKKILLSQWLALFGTILIALYPRFFAAQFYDIKNMIFVALNMITFLALANVVENCSFRNVFLFAFASALATNQRIMGVFFPVVLVGYFFLTDLTVYIYEVKKNKENIKNEIFILIIYLKNKVKKYFSIIGLYAFLWILVTPAAWTNPVKVFCETFQTFSHYDVWNGTMTFSGQFITSQERPWYYLFVWFGISIPLAYLALFIMGHIYTITLFFKCKNKWDDMLGQYKWLTCSLISFWGPLTIVIISNANIYCEWRHMYFVFVPFCCISVYGLSYLLQIINKKIVCSIMAMCISLQIFWMIRNHPYQYVYFNAVGQHFAAGFDRDNWRVASHGMLEWILEHSNEQIVTVQTNGISFFLLNEEEKKRVIIDEQDPTYIIENYRNVIGNSVEYDGYEEVYTIWVDKFKIGSVYQKR